MVQRHTTRQPGTLMLHADNAKIEAANDFSFNVAANRCSSSMQTNPIIVSIQIPRNGGIKGRPSHNNPHAGSLLGSQ